MMQEASKRLVKNEFACFYLLLYSEIIMAQEKVL